MPMIRKSAVPAVEAPVNIPPFKPARPTGPLPQPANDNFGVALQQAAGLPWPQAFKRLMPWIAVGASAYALYKLWQAMQNGAVLPSPWVLNRLCFGHVGRPAQYLNLNCTIGGANADTLVYYPNPIPAGVANVQFVWMKNNEGETNNAFQYAAIPGALYTRPNTAAPVPQPFTPWIGKSQPDPNIIRDLPGELPVPGAGEAPAPTPGWEPSIEPKPTGQPVPGSGVGVSPGTSVPTVPGVPAVPPGVDPGPRPDEWQWVPPGEETLPAPTPHARVPPPRGTKETKVRSRSARLGKAIYDALDYVSEKAEIVDALYEALPEDVKKRWSKGRSDKRGMVDSFGQYGVGGADWKLQALWHNWHKIDAAQAIRNVVQNHVEDSIIGRGQRYLPSNTVNAFNVDLGDGKSWSPEMQVSQWVDDLFNAVLE